MVSIAVFSFCYTPPGKEIPAPSSIACARACWKLKQDDWWMWWLNHKNPCRSGLITNEQPQYLVLPCSGLHCSFQRRPDLCLPLKGRRCVPELLSFWPQLCFCQRHITFPPEGEGQIFHNLSHWDQTLSVPPWVVCFWWWGIGRSRTEQRARHCPSSHLRGSPRTPPS